MYVQPQEPISTRMIRLLAPLTIPVIPCARAVWAELDLTDGERASGWADLAPYGTEVPYIVRFCPSVMADRTAGLPLGGDTTWGRPLKTDSIDGTVRVVAHVITQQFLGVERDGLDIDTARAFALLSVAEVAGANATMTLREA